MARLFHLFFPTGCPLALALLQLPGPVYVRRALENIIFLEIFFVSNTRAFYVFHTETRQKSASKASRAYTTMITPPESSPLPRRP